MPFGKLFRSRTDVTDFVYFGASTSFYQRLAIFSLSLVQFVQFVRCHECSTHVRFDHINKSTPLIHLDFGQSKIGSHKIFRELLDSTPKPESTSYRGWKHFHRGMRSVTVTFTHRTFYWRTSQ